MLNAYLPQDRLRALARAEELPEHTHGAALLADISGFTQLTERLNHALGPRRGAEVLTCYLSEVYNALLAVVERFGGSVISFAGDAITCWFDAEPPDKYVTSLPRNREATAAQPAASWRAAACGLGLHAAISQIAPALNATPSPGTPGEVPVLTLKVAVASGPAWRFVIGDPQIQLLDVLAGETVFRMAAGEKLAHPNEVLVDEATLAFLPGVQIGAGRVDSATGARFALVEYLEAPDHLPTASPTPQLSLDYLRPWLLPIVYTVETSGRSAFLTEFRPAAALFMRFTGIDYETAPARKQLDALVRLAQGVMTQYEGALLQVIIGDKSSYLYASFGAPVAHQDDRQRAVRAALALRQGVTGLDYLQPVQIGVSYGVLRAGAYGSLHRRTYGVLGDEVNLAARLMQTAAPGEILVSGRVFAAVEREFTCESRGAIILNGKTDPVTCFAVQGVQERSLLHLQEPTYTLPMVGREAELASLREDLRQVLQQGRGRAIGICAEAGMGKSRLAAQVIRVARQQNWIGYGGVCQVGRSSLAPYQVWRDVWAGFFDLKPDLALAEKQRSLSEQVETLAPERLAALPLLGAVLGLPLPHNEFTQSLEPKYRKVALEALLVDCLQGAARQAAQMHTGLILILEDLHWIDPLSRDLLEQIVIACAELPVLVLLTYRPLEEHATPLRLENLAHFRQIVLAELTPSESEHLFQLVLEQLFPGSQGAAPGLVENLVAHAQGNPFYLEELLRYLHDQGFDPHAHQVLECIDLPDSLHALVLSRIDQLQDQQKMTLKLASVIGRVFTLHWLHGYYPEQGTPAEIQANLDVLSRLDLTPLDIPGANPAYIFKHIITREVAYESLSFAARAELHERLAQFIEAMPGSIEERGMLETLAYHYARSHNLPKQREYLLRASEAALAVSAFTTVLEYLVHLDALVPADDPDRCSLSLKLAQAHYRLGDYPAAHAAIERAQATATTDVERANALVALGEMINQSGNSAGALAVLTEAVPLARLSGDPSTLSQALSTLGDVKWRMGRLDEARAAQEESLALARACGDVRRELSTLNRLGTLAGAEGNWNAAELLWQQAYTRALAMGERSTAMVLLNNLGVLAYQRQDDAATQGCFQQALKLAREIGVKQMIAGILSNLAEVNIKLGQFSAARSELRESLKLALQLGALTEAVAAVKYLGYLAYAEENRDQAWVLLGLARSHPSWNSELQRDLDATLAQWGCDPTIVEAGMAQGMALNWETTIRELLQE